MSNLSRDRELPRSLPAAVAVRVVFMQVPRHCSFVCSLALEMSWQMCDGIPNIELSNQETLSNPALDFVHQRNLSLLAFPNVRLHRIFGCSTDGLCC